jgi:serine/threonine protein kinase/dipeptidyl aminopeptidase/acylaminoacyl peptidase
MIGQTISHYQILEKLGEGGMGVVYKAQDTKLNRVVALKFLPDRVNRSEGDKARFMQEAQAAASLNHANICTIHGVEEVEGKMFIAMEYIEGGTLREKIVGAMHASPKGRGGQLSAPTVDDAINIAVQIGEALQEAHSKGIVHRDIKADNIMLTSKGQAKVMDFGLAKLKGAMKLTRTSSTVGTLGYMAPEQIQGAEADQRSDIFSFGVLLFEMLAGRLPFRGEHEAAMVYSIVNEEPQNIEQFVPNVSPLVTHLIQRCLEKDPADRYQHFDDITADLRRSQKKTSQMSRTRLKTDNVYSPATAQTLDAPESGERPSLAGSISRKKLWVGAGIALLFIVVAGVLLLRTGTHQLNPNMTFRTIQMPYTDFQYPGLTQDGNWIVFPAADANRKWDLYWMHKSGGEARRVTFDSSLAPPARFLGADISPDGSQIAYNRVARAGVLPDLCVVSSNGGIGRKVASRALAARWNPDGSRIGFITFARGGGSIAVNSVKPDGTDNRAEFVDSLGVPNNISFGWSPDGESIAWIRGFKNATAELITHNVRTNAEKQLTFDGKLLDEVFWTGQNSIIFSTTKSGNTNLWSIPAGGGDAVQITKGSGPDLGMKLSADGQTLLYYQNQTTGNIWLADGQAANLQQLTSDDRSISALSISAVGDKIAFVMNNDDAGFVAAEFHLFVMDRDGRTRRQLTFGKEVVDRPRFSPDGKYIAYLSRGPLEPVDSLKVSIVGSNGSDQARTLRAGSTFEWINESELSVYHRVSSYRVPISGGAGTKLMEDSLIVRSIATGEPTFYGDTRFGRGGLWTLPANSKMSRRLLDDGEQGLFVPRARFAYVIGADRNLWKVSVVDGKRERIRGTLPDVGAINLLSVRPDGKEIAFIRRQSRGKLVMIENLLK